MTIANNAIIDANDIIAIRNTANAAVAPGSSPTFVVLTLTGLPTSPAGLAVGSIWNNAGVLCIV